MRLLNPALTALLGDKDLQAGTLPPVLTRCLKDLLWSYEAPRLLPLMRALEGTGFWLVRSEFALTKSQSLVWLQHLALTPVGGREQIKEVEALTGLDPLSSPDDVRLALCPLYDEVGHYSGCPAVELSFRRAASETEADRVAGYQVRSVYTEMPCEGGERIYPPGSWYLVRSAQGYAARPRLEGVISTFNIEFFRANPVLRRELQTRMEAFLKKPARLRRVGRNTEFFAFTCPIRCTPEEVRAQLEGAWFIQGITSQEQFEALTSIPDLPRTKPPFDDLVYHDRLAQVVSYGLVSAPNEGGRVCAPVLDVNVVQGGDTTIYVSRLGEMVLTPVEGVHCFPVGLVCLLQLRPSFSPVRGSVVPPAPSS